MNGHHDPNRSAIWADFLLQPPAAVVRVFFFFCYFFQMHALSRNTTIHTHVLKMLLIAFKKSPQLFKKQKKKTTTTTTITFDAFLHGKIHQSTLNWRRDQRSRFPSKLRSITLVLFVKASALPLAALHYSIFTEVSASLLWAVNWPQMYGVVRAKEHP